MPTPGSGSRTTSWSRWALDIQRHNQAFDPLLQMVEWYRPLRELGHDVEIVHPSATLDAFQLVVAPSLHVVEPSMVEALRDFVARGGHLVLGPRTGVKDIDNALFPMRGPGPLGELSPARVEEFYVLDETIAIHGSMRSGPPDGGSTDDDATHKGRARIWADWLEPVSAGAEVLLRYAQAGAWVDGKAAAVTHALGKGRVTLLGTWLDHATMLSLMRRIVAWSGLGAASPCGEPPMGVEICRRVKGTDEVWIVINHGREAHTLRFDEPMRDLLGAAEGRALEIGALAVRVLQRAAVLA